VSFAAGEIKQPTRDLPRSLFHGTLIITGSSLLANAAYYSVLSGAEIRQGDTVAATAMSQAFGPIASGFVSLLILVSIFGAMNGMVLTGPRVYYAMAKEGLFFNAFSQLNARYRTPIVAIVVQGVWASLLTLLGTFQELFTYVIFTAWIFYGLTVAGVIVLRRKQPALERPFRVPAFPWLPAFFCLAAFGITVSTIVADPHHALLGIAVILAGLPVYALFRRRANLLGASPGNQSR
jgi:APA family basic amino acid/polyamine antiporter